MLEGSTIVGILLLGLVVGALARLALPGPQPIGCLGTIAVGVAGAVVGGLLGQALGVRGPLLSWVMAVIGAILVLLAFQSLRGGISRRR